MITKNLLAGVAGMLVLAGALLHAGNEIEPENPDRDSRVTQSLITLLPTKTEVGFWQLHAGKHPEGRQVTIEGNPRTDYLLAHAPSRVEYDIPAGAASFSALGVSTSNQSCTFSVAVDGKVMFASKSLETYSHGVVDINVMLPKDSKKLELITTHVGNFSGCQTCWVEPRFVNLPGFGQTLPVARTVIDTAGRGLEGTILSKDADSIRFRRTSDGKDFDLPLAKLTADDQAFIARLAAPTKSSGIKIVIFKPTENVIKKVLAKGLDVTLVDRENQMLPAWKTLYKSEKEIGNPNEFIKPFDVYWADDMGTVGIGKDVLKAADEAKKLIVLMDFDHKRTLRYVYSGEDTKWAGKIEYKNYFTPEKGCIRYGDRSKKDAYDPSIVDKVMDEIVNQLK